MKSNYYQEPSEIDQIVFDKVVPAEHHLRRVKELIDPFIRIEQRHFAWMKRYFGLKYFQCYSWMRVTQFVLLTNCATLAVALAAQRYERLELIRRRAMVLAQL